MKYHELPRFQRPFRTSPKTLSHLDAELGSGRSTPPLTRDGILVQLLPSSIELLGLERGG